MNRFLDKEITMEKIVYDLEECPICRGAGILTHEGGWNVQVECADCSAHTVFVEYNNEKEKLEAEQKVVTLWNIGKVVRSDVGE
jgi:hypothetical protein